MIKRIRIKPNPNRNVRGSSPGLVELRADALKPKIVLHAYNADEYVVTEVNEIKELDELIARYQHLTQWVDVRGLGDLELFDFIGRRFGIHKLVLEDIASAYQRPKLDEYEGYLFVTTRMLYINEDLEIENEQISFLLMENLLFSFQENYEECIEPVVTRLKGGKGNIRIAGPSYLLYTLLDVIVDDYFSLIYRLGDELDIIEELLYRRPKKEIMYKIQEIKRAMILIRRAAWPERDMVNDMIRSDSTLISKETRTFLRDVYDHCMQVVDLVESYKDVTTTLIDMSLAIVSNRMNEIMKVLTIMSSIFIPLTFIAGVYGMNFAYQDPKTGKIMPHNMPELYAANGYLYTLIVMGLIAIGQVIFFWRKGWFK